MEKKKPIILCSNSFDSKKSTSTQSFVTYLVVPLALRDQEGLEHLVHHLLSFQGAHEVQVGLVSRAPLTRTSKGVAVKKSCCDF